MSIARVITTKLTSTIAKGSRLVQVGFVETTDVWKRSFLDSDVEKEFKAVALHHIDSYRPETTAIALQLVLAPRDISAVSLVLINKNTPIGRSLIKANPTSKPTSAP